MKRFSKVLFLTSFSFSLFGGSATWNIDADGDWNIDANWNPATGYPNGIDEFAEFGSVITANRDVTVTAPVTAGSISFDNANSYSILSGTITVQATSNTGTLTSTNGAHSIASDIVLTSSLLSSINSSGNFTLSGILSGAGSLTKSGAGTLVYTGTSANTYTGLTAINAGELQLNKTAGIDAVAGSLTIATGGLVTLLASDQLGSNSDVTIAGGILNMGGNSDSINSLTMTDGTLTQTGASLLTLTSNNTALTMGSATLSGNVLLSGTGTFTFTGAATRANVAGTLDLGSSTHIFSIGNGADTIDTNISAAIVGSGGFTKQGTGSLSLSGSSNNTYTGTTTVALNSGILALNKPPGISAFNGDLVIVGGGVVSVNGPNQINHVPNVSIDTIGASVGTLTLNGNPLTVHNFFQNGVFSQGGTGTLTVTGSVTLGRTINGSLIFSGATLLTASGVAPALQGFVNLGGSEVIFDVQSSLNGNGLTSISNGSLTKTGPGQYTSGNAGNYTGDTKVIEGRFFLSGGNAINTNSRVIVGGGTTTAWLTFQVPFNPTNFLDVTVNSNGSITQFPDVAVYLKALQGSGMCALSSAASEYTFLLYQGTVSTTYSGTITGGITNGAGDPALGNRIFKAGTSTLTLSGNSNFLSPLFIQQGVIDATSSSALGAAGANSAVYVLGTGTPGSLYLENNITLDKTILLNGPGFSSLGALRNVSGDNTLTGDITMGWTGGTVTLVNPTIRTEANTTLTLTGIVQGTASPTVTGDGTLVYSGVSANTNSGTVTVNGGRLELSKPTGVIAIAGSLTVAGGTVFMTNADQIVNTAVVSISSGELNVNNFPTTLQSLSFTGGSLTQGTTGTLTINSAAATALTMGNNVIIPNDLAFSNPGGVTYSGSTGTATIQGNLDLGSNLGHTFTINGGPVVGIDIQGIISNTGSITKTGTGTLRFSGLSANTYSGLTTVSAGNLILDKTDSITAIGGDLLVNGGIVTYSANDQIGTSSSVVIDSGTINMSNFSDGFNSITINTGSLLQSPVSNLNLTSAATALTMQGGATTSGAGSIILAGSGTVAFDSTLNGTATIGGNLNLGGSPVIFDIADGTAAVDMIVSGTISNGALIKNNAGVLQLSGSSANTYTGTTTVNAGNLILNKPSGVNAIFGNLLVNGGIVTYSANDQIATGSSVVIGSGTINMAAFSDTLNSIAINTGSLVQSLGSNLTLASTATALTMQGGATTSSTGSITLSNSGTVAFDSTLNGTATIGGNLSLGGSPVIFDIADGTEAIDMIVSGPISSGALIKNNAGVLQFSGSSANTYTGTTTVNTGSLLLNKSSGVDAIAGPLVIAGGTVQLQNADQISTSSDVTINSGHFDLNSNPTTLASLTFSSGSLTQGATGTLTLSSVATALTVGDDVVIPNDLTFSNPGGVTYSGSTGTATIQGSLDLGPSFNHTFAINGGPAVAIDIQGTISNTGSITKTGTGTLQFSGSLTNTYTGSTVVSAGNLILNKADGIDAIGGDLLVNGGIVTYNAEDQIATNSSVVIGSGTINMAAFSDTLNSIAINTGSLIQSLGSNLTLASAATALTMQGGATTSGAGSITLSGSGTVAFDSTLNGTATIGGNLSLGGSSVIFDVANGSAAVDMIVSGPISSGALIKNNAGVLQFSGSSANTYTGTTTVNAGSLLLNKSSGVDAIAGPLVITGGTVQLQNANQISTSSDATISGGHFDLNSNPTTLASLTFSSGSLTQGATGTITLTSIATALTMGDDVVIPNDLTFFAAGGVTYSGSTGTATIQGNLIGSNLSHTFTINGGPAIAMDIQGTISNIATLTKTGAGTLQFSGSSANTYTGSTIVSAGNLILNKPSGLDAIPGDLLVNGGIVTYNADEQIATNSSVTIGSGTINMAAFSDTLNSIAINTGSLIQSLGSNLTLASAATALTMQGGATTSGAGSITLSNSGTVAFDSTLNGTATIGGNLSLGGSPVIFDIANGTAAVDMIVSGTISSGALVKNNAGVLQLSGSSANTYTGTTTVNAGNLILNKSSGVDAIFGDLFVNGGIVTYNADEQIATNSSVTIGSGTINMAAFSDTLNSIVINTGSLLQSLGSNLTLASAATALTMQGGATTSGAGNITLSGSGTVAFDSTLNGTATIGGNLSLGGSPVIFDIADGSAAVDMIVSGPISNGALVKNNAGVLQFSGSSANTYTGTTTVNTGSLLLNKSSGVDAIAGPLVIAGGTVQLQGANQIASSSDVTINSGLFDLNNNPTNLASLTFTSGSLTQGANGTLTLTSVATALTVSDDVVIPNDLTFSNAGGVAYSGSTGTATIQGNLNLGSNLGHTFTINGGPEVSIDIQGTISNTGSITKIGTGTLQFSGSLTNTYSGTTTVNAGNLILNKSSGANAIFGNLLVNGGIVTYNADDQIATGSSVVIGSGTINMDTFSDTLNSITINTGSLVQSLGSNLTLASAATALTMQGGAATSGAGSITLSGSGTVAFDSTLNGTATIGGNLSLGGSSVIFDVANGSAAVDMIVSGPISNGALVKNNAGVLQFSGSSANTYAGTTTVNAGSLLLNKSSGVDAIAGPLVIAGGTVQLQNANQISTSSDATISGGHFDLNSNPTTLASLTFSSGSLTQGTNGTITLTSAANTALILGNDVVIPNDLTFFAAGGATYNGSTGTATIQGNLIGSNLSHTFTINGGPAIAIDIQGTISNIATLTKTGTGTLRFSGLSANTYTGSTIVSAGNLILNKAASMDAVAGNLFVNGGIVTYNADDQVSPSSDVTINSGTINMAAFSDTFNSLVLSGGSLLQLVGSNLTLASTNTALTMQAGATTSGSGSITLSGSGTILFNNAVNGTATIGGNLDLGGSPVIFDIPASGAAIDMSIPGVISNGTLIKNSSGILALSGINTYTGGTTLNAGTLRVRAASLPGNAAINNGTTLIFAEPSSGTYSGVISQIAGTAAVNIVGPGTVTFGGISSNSYNGVTTVSAGSLILNRPSAIAIPGNLLINGGSVRQLAVDQFNTTTNTTLSSGGLDLQGFNAEMQSLTYNGGALTLSGGVLSLNSSSTALTFGSQTINGQIDLTGIGAPAVSSNTGGNAQITSLNVTNPATNLTLQLTGGGTLTLLSSSSQGGGLIQNGANTLILASGIHDFTGGTSQVNGGTLSVLGNFSTSTLNVAPNTLLKGTGTITGNVTLQGTVEPGNSIGTLNIVGSYTFANGSDYHVELNTTSADLINVTGVPGTIVIQPGSTITLQPQSGSFFSADTVYTLLSASGGLTGEFSQVTFENPIGINYSLVYGLNDLTLQVATKPLPIIFPGGGSGNVDKVAETLNDLRPGATGDLVTVLSALFTLDSEEALINALNQLQPSMLKGLTNIAAENTAIRNQDIIEQRLHQIIYRDCSKKTPKKMLSIWTDLMGDYLHQSTKSLQPGFSLASGSASIGIDYTNSGFFLGFASSYQYSDLDWKYSRGHGNINSLFGNLYGGWFNNRFFADIAIQGGINHFHETRHIDFPGINRYASANFNGGSLLSSAGVGMIFNAASIEFKPFINAEYLYLHQQAFQETGASSINLDVRSSNENMLRAETGINLSRCFLLRKYNIRLDGSLSYIHEQRLEGAKFKTAFIDTDLYFTVRGMNPDRNLFSPGLSLTILSKDGKYAGSLTYQGEIGSHYWDQNGQFQFGYRF